MELDNIGIMPYAKGKQAYKNWRVDKNISWHNLTTYPMGIVFGLVTFEWILDSKSFIERLKPWEIWIPTTWG